MKTSLTRKLEVAITVLVNTVAFVVFVFMLYRMYRDIGETPPAIIGIVAIVLTIAFTVIFAYNYLWHKHPAIECDSFVDFVRKQPRKNMYVLICTVLATLVPFSMFFGGIMLLSRTFDMPISTAMLITLFAIGLVVLIFGATFEWLWRAYKQNKKAPVEVATINKHGIIIVGVLAAAFTTIVFIQTSRAALKPPPPPWALQDEWRNPNPTNATTCGALANTISEAYRYVRTNGTLMPYQGLQLMEHGWAYPYDPHLSDVFIQKFLAGFSADSMSQVLPFSTQFLEHTLENTFMYFAFPPTAYRFHGRAYTSETRSYVFVGTANASAFLNLALHEIGHDLGLGESLTGLFAEEFLGLEHSVQDPASQQTILNTHQGGSWPGGLYYNSTFDRKLLRKLEAEGRAYEFWYAAFHSNAAYAQLWNRYMSEYMTFRQMQSARALYAVLINPFGVADRALQDEFREYAGIQIHWVISQIITDWRIIADTNRGNDEARNTALLRLAENMHIVDEFARIQNIPPRQAVMDGILNIHRLRYPNYEGRGIERYLNFIR